MIIEFGGKLPRIGNNVFIAPDAWIIGDVTIEDNCSIFFGVVIRGDIEPITIGKNSNIQEHSVIHTSTGKGGVIIGSNVTIGHRATIHGACVQDCCLIGMGSTLLDNALIETQSIIGAGSLVPEQKVIEAGSLALGSPSKIVRQLTENEKEFLLLSANHYIEKGRQYQQIFQNPDGLK